MNERIGTRSRRPPDPMKVVVAVAFVGVGLAAPPIATCGTDAEIRLDMSSGRPQVDVSLDGHGPYPFVLDTGAGQHVIDAGLARELGLAVVGRTEVGAPGLDGTTVDVVRVPGATLQGVNLGAVEFATSDLATMSRGQFLGVLGIRAFADSLASLDVSGATLRLSTAGLEAGGSVRFDSAAGQIEVPIEVGGRKLVAHLDTGSPSGIVVPRELAEGLEFLAEPVQVGHVMLVGGTGSIFKATLDGAVVIGDIRIENPDLNLLDLPVPAVNLGNGFLAGYVVHIDQRHGLVRFERRAGDSAPVVARVPPAPRPQPGAQRRRLGIHPAPGAPGPHGLPLVDGGLSVGGVEAGSVAGAAGLAVGDLIVSVNGRPMTELDPAALGALFGGSEPLRLEVRKNGSTSLEVVEIR